MFGQDAILSVRLLGREKRKLSIEFPWRRGTRRHLYFLDKSEVCGWAIWYHIDIHLKYILSKHKGHRSECPQVWTGLFEKARPVIWATTSMQGCITTTYQPSQSPGNQLETKSKVFIVCVWYVCSICLWICVLVTRIVRVDVEGNAKACVPLFLFGKLVEAWLT
jgi:hypothetical protein